MQRFSLLVRVGLDSATVEVRCADLNVEAELMLGNRALPTVLNSYRNFFEVSLHNVQLACLMT